MKARPILDRLLPINLKSEFYKSGISSRLLMTYSELFCPLHMASPHHPEVQQVSLRDPLLHYLSLFDFRRHTEMELVLDAHVSEMHLEEVCRSLGLYCVICSRKRPPVARISNLGLLLSSELGIISLIL